MLLPPRYYSTERTLHRTQQEREGRRKGGRKGGICLAGMNPLHPLLLLSPFLPHTHVRGKEDSSPSSFPLWSRDVSIYRPDAKKKSDGGGSWLPGRAVKVWRQRGSFLPSLSSLWPRTFARITIACRQTTAAAAASFQSNPPSSGFFFLSRSREENLPGCLSCFSSFFCVASRDSALRESVRKDIGGKMQLGSWNARLQSQLLLCNNFSERQRSS